MMVASKEAEDAIIRLDEACGWYSYDPATQRPSVDVALAIKANAVSCGFCVFQTKWYGWKWCWEIPRRMLFKPIDETTLTRLRSLFRDDDVERS